MDKNFVIGIIDAFESHSQRVPQELRMKLLHIRSNIESMTQDDFDLRSNGAVSTTPTMESPEEQNPMEDLREVYSELEEISLSRNREPELERAIHQLRGILDISDSYFP